MRLLHSAWFAALAALAPAPTSTAGAAVQTSDVPTFTYQDRVLAVGFVSYAQGKGEITWRAFQDDGTLGPARRRALQLQLGLNGIELPVGAESAHLVSIKSEGRQLELMANRGSWFALPRALRIDQTQKEAGFDTKLTTPRDVVLARGFSAVATQGDGVSPLEVGRTFTRGTEGGVRLAGFAGVVLVAGGSVGPVRLTLTERRGRVNVYWDTEIDLVPEFRRLVIPFSRLIPREVTTRKRPGSAYSVSLRASAPTRRGGGLEIDLVGLVREVPEFAAPSRRGEVLRFPPPPKSSFSSVQLHVVEESGARRVETIEQKPFDLRSLGQIDYWYCYEEQTGASVCDPPDAPSTSHAIAPMPGGRLVVDDFDRRAAVNRFRQPVEPFASDPVMSARPFMLRKKGSVLLRLDEAPLGSYIGLKVPLPSLDPNLRTLELVFQGVAGAAGVDVGLSTSSGAEPKVPLSEYLRAGDGRTVRIPLEAFRALHRATPRAKKFGRPVAVTLALTPGSNLELDRVALNWEVAPMTVARFEGTGALRTSLGGRVAARGTGAARVRSSTITVGDGQALKVEIARSAGPSSIIVALGFGASDTRAYESLVFSLTNQANAASAAVQLHAGSKLARVPLGRYAQGVGRLERVTVPLRDFGGRLPRQRLTQISIVFEGGDAGTGLVELDDVRFE